MALKKPAADEEHRKVVRELALKKAELLNQTYDKEPTAAAQLNSTYTKPADTSSAKLNSTYSKDTTIQSYDITPARHELPPSPLKDEDNYDIDGLKSDDDTDDEDAPRKNIPKWAQGKSSNPAKNGVPPRFELGSLNPKSSMLTITP